MKAEKLPSEGRDTHPKKAEKLFLVVQKEKQGILGGQKQTQGHLVCLCG